MVARILLSLLKSTKTTETLKDITSAKNLSVLQSLSLSGSLHFPVTTPSKQITDSRQNKTG